MPPTPPSPPPPSIAISPTPPPPPSVPAVAVAQPAVVGSTLNAGLVLAAVGIMAATALVGLAMVIGAVVYFGGFRPSPGPAAVDFKKLGREYAKDLGATYAPAWKGYAADIRAGKSMNDAMKAANELWARNRAAILAAKLRPALNALIPEGTADDKITPAQREAMAAAAEDFAQGLEQGP